MTYLYFLSTFLYSSFFLNLDRIVISSWPAAAQSPPAHKSRLERRDLGTVPRSWMLHLALYHDFPCRYPYETTMLQCSFEFYYVFWFVLLGRTLCLHTPQAHSCFVNHSQYAVYSKLINNYFAHSLLLKKENLFLLT